MDFRNSEAETQFSDMIKSRVGTDVVINGIQWVEEPEEQSRRKGNAKERFIASLAAFRLSVGNGVSDCVISLK